MFELSGNVKEIFPEQTFASGFNKREFVVTTGEKYPQDISFECVKEKVSLVDGLNKGESVKVFFDIRGREWNGKYFVNLNAWKIEKGGSAASEGTHAESSAPPPSGEIGEDDDVPF